MSHHFDFDALDQTNNNNQNKNKNKLNRRPRAPKRTDSNNFNNNNNKNEKKENKVYTRPKTRSIKHISLEESFENLDYFSKTNLSRFETNKIGYNGDEDFIDLTSSHLPDSIHFVNIENLNINTKTFNTTPSPDLKHFKKFNKKKKNENNNNNNNNNNNKNMKKKKKRIRNNNNNNNNNKINENKIIDDQENKLFSIRDIIEDENGEIKSTPSNLFQIPELPKGKLLTINILSTWGDQYYLGLMGIDIFDKSGHKVTLLNPERQIWADPADINVLPEYNSDPRIVDNLIDSHNFTCDDLHAWLAPFNHGKNHLIFIKFNEITTISMIRVWNYNKSRIHSYRGARYIEISLDKRFIFKGEIKKAPGNVSSADLCSECILFTRNDNILRIIEKYDTNYSDLTQDIDKYFNTGDKLKSNNDNQSNFNNEIILDTPRHNWNPLTLNIGRPKTAARRESLSILHDINSEYNNNPLYKLENNDNNNYDNNRNQNDNISIHGQKFSLNNNNNLFQKKKKLYTNKNKKSFNNLKININNDMNIKGSMKKLNTRDSPILKPKKQIDIFYNNNNNLIRPRTAPKKKISKPLIGQFLKLNLESNWGDQNYIGLTGIQILDIELNPIQLPNDVITIENDINNNSDLNNLLNDKLITTDSNDMWLYSNWKGYLTLIIDLQEIKSIYGLKIYNYNSSIEDSYSGVKRMSVTMDDLKVNKIENSFLIRKAPGNSNFDFGQYLLFHDEKNSMKNQLRNLISEDNSLNDEPYNNNKNKSLSPLSPLSINNSPINDKYNNIKNNFSNDIFLDSPNENSFNDSDDNMLNQTVCEIPQQYQTYLYPCGCMIKFALLSTHGDNYYIGLNGFEIYDKEGQLIELTEENVYATPSDINCLPEFANFNDPRTVDKLYNGRYNHYTDEDMWLAPFVENNTIYICFDQAITISYIKFWNYSKTPTRGVSDIEISVDDVLIYRGVLKKAPDKRGSNTSSPANTRERSGSIESNNGYESFVQSILFTNNPQILLNEASNVYTIEELADDQSIVFIDEGTTLEFENKANQRPTTSVKRFRKRRK